MCGICGLVYKDPGRTAAAETIKPMCDTIRHRGPDDEGRIVLGSCGLGMRRLSIIDLSTGHQPLTNEDGTLWIVFNGEIYNFQSLRAELEKLGHRFRTHSDTEAIVHGYEAWGDGVPEYLNGMFSFAIWDTKRRRLFMARDRLGIKPLYYYEDSEKIVFGSELKTILKAPDIHKTLDLAALDNFLTFEYVPSPKSIFREIRKLPQGHTMAVENGKISIQPYWQLIPKEITISESDARERLAELVQDAVRLRLISDVPLGAFLSGGIDSSIIVSQMAGLMDQPVKTFSIGFKESSYNELNYARAVARVYATDHHEFIIEADALELTEKLFGYFDEPFGDFSIFPTYLVSKMARDHVTVCLSGDGGDELFAGYDAYKAHRFDRTVYRRIPRWIKQGMIHPFARRLPPTEQKKGLSNSIKRFAAGAELSDALLHARWMTFLDPAERQSLFTDDVLQILRAENPYSHILNAAWSDETLDDITRTGYIDVKTYLADDILVKVDRMSMAVSLEARVPYLDHRIVEFAFSLPPHLKMDGYKTKVLLNRTFWDKLPVEVQNRDKQGFSIPIKNWIRNELRPMMQDLLDPSRIKSQGIFREPFISRLMEEHIRGRENHSHKLWALMVFQKWNEMYGSG